MNKIALPASNSGMVEDRRIREAADMELVSRCQRGDTQAFNELVNQYRGKVYAMIYNMIHNEQDAWDLTQDGFLKAWKSMGRFQGQSAFYTWLYRIVMNSTIDWMRQRKIAGEGEFDEECSLGQVDARATTVPHSDPLPFQKMERDEIRKRIDAAVDQLSPEHRAVIVMREMDGMPYDEIAAVLDCSTGTVMSRLFYARKKLQSALRDLYEAI